jgi:hypothetical protein
MGMNAKDLGLLIKLAREGHIQKKSSIIEIGAQQCANCLLSCEDKIKILGALFDIHTPHPLPKPGIRQFINGLELLETQAPPTSILWKWLEFNYFSVDLDESFDSLFIDLNYDEIPHEEREKYQIVTNFGTTEHVVNQLQAFKIIHDLTNAKGIMIHNVPTQGYQTHGLINYNPKFFWTLARSNNYEWIFADYVSSEIYQDLHPAILEEKAKFCDDIRERGKRYKSADATITIVLKKNISHPFVSPLDISTGTKTTNAILKNRYLNVFSD